MKPMNQFDVSVDVVEKLRRDFVGRESALSAALRNKRVVLGFDGYVDRLYQLVERRDDPTSFAAMESMLTLADRVAATAGSSCNLERVLKKKIAGGFAPNVARCLAHLGFPVDLVGMLGLPEPDPLFTEFPDVVELHTIGNPGETVALEFADGKVMLTDFGPINELTWEDLLSRLGGVERLAEMLERADALGQGHWSLVPAMNQFWERLQGEVVPSLSDATIRRMVLLVDPADLKKRSRADVRSMLKLLRGFEDAGLSCCLSLNDREAADVASALESVGDASTREELHDVGRKINSVADLSLLVVHDPHFATASTRDRHVLVQEGFTAKPKFTTAAGDHFNGGLLAGLLLGLAPEEALAVGNAVTAIFVRTGASPDLVATCAFLERYEEFVDADLPDFSLP
ncbi:MAG: hypothetical protein Kow0069_28540 [Promethearchaeota archaeon]